MKQLLFCSLQILIIVLFCPLVHAEESPATYLKQDPRLSETISVVSKRIYIGELTEQFASQSGVFITAGDQDGAADVAVTVSLHRIPLVQAMNALQSLVSYQGLQWQWERSGQSGNYQYKLTQPGAARALPQLIQKQIQEQFESEAEKLKAALTMTPDQLTEAAKDDPMLQSFAKGDDPRVRPGMTIFSELSPEAQSLILQDHQTVQMPVSGLSPAGRDFVYQQWLQDRANGDMTKNKQDGQWVPVPEPQFINIGADIFPGDMVPVLTLDTGTGSGGYVGGGWMENDWTNKIETMWKLASDMNDDGNSRKIISPPANSNLIDSRYQIASLLLEIGDATSVPLMARLPDEGLHGRNMSGMSPFGQSIKSYLVRLKEAKIAHKWRDHVLLLNDPSWLTSEEETTDVPWLIVKRLRENEAKNYVLTLDDLEQTASELTVPQLHSLSSSFPVMANVADWHDLFAEIGSSPSLKPESVSSSGTDWTGAVHAAAAVMGPDAQQLVQDGSATYVRIVQQRHEGQTKPALDIDIQLLSDKKENEASGRSRAAGYLKSL